MKYECSVIEDLLPLYKDGVCSEESRKAVDEHLAECPKCTEVYNALKDTAIDEMIVKEKEDVIGSQSKYFKRKSAMIGSIIAGIFALPILICLIVNLASSQRLSWFFIVFAAMLIPTSLFVVPLIAEKNRMFLTMCSFTASVILLLAVICIYSGGTWFLAAAPATLFGLTVCFAPFIACRRPVRDHLGNRKGITVMTAYTVTFILMMICIGLYVQEHGFFGMAFSISLPLLIMAWLIFLVVRYLPVNGLIKAAICIAAISAFNFLGNEVIMWLMLRNTDQPAVSYQIELPGVMYIGFGVAAVLAAAGFLRMKKKGGQTDEQA